MFIYQRKINNYSALIIQNTQAMYPMDDVAVVAIYTDEEGNFTYALGKFEDGEFIYGDQPVSLPEVTIDDNGKVLTVVDGEWSVAEPISGISFSIVEELPEIGDTSVVYLVPIDDEAESDIYAEYIYVDGAFEKFGTTTVPGTIVTANPTLQGDEAILTGLEVDGTKYRIDTATYKSFNNGWTTNGTIKQFCASVDADASAVKGSAYLGELRCSDLPAGLANVEAVVEIVDGTGTSGKVIHIVITSGNLAPYRWEYTYWNSGSNVSGWITFQQSLVSGTNIKTINGNTLLGSGDLVVETDISGKQDTLVSGTNIKTINNESILGSGNITISGDVTSVNNKTGAVNLTKSDIGLSNVDNTSDANKPISTATQTALNQKQNALESGINIKTINRESILGSGNIDIQSGSSIRSSVSFMDLLNSRADIDSSHGFYDALNVLQNYDWTNSSASNKIYASINFDGPASRLFLQEAFNNGRIIGAIRDIDLEAEEIRFIYSLMILPSDESDINIINHYDWWGNGTLARNSTGNWEVTLDDYSMGLGRGFTTHINKDVSKGYEINPVILQPFSIVGIGVADGSGGSQPPVISQYIPISNSMRENLIVSSVSLAFAQG